MVVNETSVSMTSNCDKYPLIGRKANVIPAHKKESRHSKTNYRPITLLPVFGKMYQKLTFDAIYIHLCQNNLISSNYSGFCPGDSTINQLLLITNKIYSVFDETPPKELRATVSAGVLQGFVLGPLFFLIYINDIVDNIASDVTLFAGDTSLQQNWIMKL